MTDNAQEFRSAEFDRAVARLGARHLFIRAGRPQTNGVVERVQETILEECWKPAFARYLIPKYTGLRLDLERAVFPDVGLPEGIQLTEIQATMPSFEETPPGAAEDE